MQSNVIAFDRNRKATTAAAATARAAAEGFRDNVISLADFRARARTRARRTANGVFFSTGVLCTIGSAA